MTRPLPLTMQQAAERATCCRRTLENAVKRGELPVLRIGRSVRVLDVDLDAWILSKRVTA